MGILVAPTARAAALALLVATLAVPAQAEAASGVNHANALERNLRAKINTYRANKGLRKLSVVRPLQTAAAKHALNMANNGYFSHNWSSGARYSRWIRWYWPGSGYGSWSAGENLYWAAPGTTASAVLRGWKNSSGHNANLLRSSWRNVGLGAVRVRDPLGMFRAFGSVTIVSAEFGYRR
jgi:uncharacterized protein YkwD